MVITQRIAMKKINQRLLLQQNKTSLDDNEVADMFCDSFKEYLVEDTANWTSTTVDCECKGDPFRQFDVYCKHQILGGTEFELVANNSHITSLKQCVDSCRTWSSVSRTTCKRLCTTDTFDINGDLEPFCHATWDGHVCGACMADKSICGTNANDTGHIINDCFATERLAYGELCGDHFTGEFSPSPYGGFTPPTPSHSGYHPHSSGAYHSSSSSGGSADDLISLFFILVLMRFYIWLRKLIRLGHNLSAIQDVPTRPEMELSTRRAAITATPVCTSSIIALRHDDGGQEPFTEPMAVAARIV